jgi:hypothetical protein
MLSESFMEGLLWEFPDDFFPRREFKKAARLSRYYVRSLSQNSGCYPAFLAIAHGLARWDDNTQEVVLEPVQESSTNK